jgi:putative restriction endonuclease
MHKPRAAPDYAVGCILLQSSFFFSRDECGYLTVAPDYRVEVSRRLKDEFDNGKEYYALQGKTILLPGNPSFRPSAEQLGWHNDHVYRP